jgi:hypothetical protein
MRHPVDMRQYQEERASFRILEQVRLLSERGYTAEEYEKDVDAALACALIMAVEGPTDHMHRILRSYMERITAGGMLK